MQEQIRAEVVSLLNGFKPFDRAEEESLAELRKLLRSSVPLAERSCKCHITAATVVTDSRFRQIALHHHAKSGLWLQPGGHIEASEGILAAARRELLEEYGGDADYEAGLFDISAHNSGPCRHIELRFCAVNDRLDSLLSPEGRAIKVFELDELIKTFGENPAQHDVVRFALKLKSRLGQSG